MTINRTVRRTVSQIQRRSLQETLDRVPYRPKPTEANWDAVSPGLLQAVVHSLTLPSKWATQSKKPPETALKYADRYVAVIEAKHRQGQPVETPSSFFRAALDGLRETGTPQIRQHAQALQERYAGLFRDAFPGLAP